MFFFLSPLTLLLKFLLFLSFSNNLTNFTTRGLVLLSQGMCGSPLIKVTFAELSISNLRYPFTLNERITLSYVERSSRTKQVPSRCLLLQSHFLPQISDSYGQGWS